MPQPVRKACVIDLNPSAIASRPTLAVQLAQITSLSAHMETRLSALLAMISGGSASVTMAMYQSVSSTEAQRSMVLAAAEATLKGSELSEITELLEDYKPRARERNKMVHGIWATSEDHPEALLLCRAVDIGAAWKTIATSSLEESAIHAGKLWEGFLIYKGKDFDDVISRLSSFDQRLTGVIQEFLERKDFMQKIVAPTPPA